MLDQFNTVSNFTAWFIQKKWKIFIWLLIGLLIVLISTLCLYIFIDLLELPVEIATLINAEILILFRYYLLKVFIFKSKTKNLLINLFNFHIASTAGFAIWWLITNFMINQGFFYIYANLIGIIFSVFFNFISHFFWIWKDDRKN
jgi:putative flippase GtrA